MNQLLEAREKISNFFDNSENCQRYFFADENSDDYAAYYTAMYLMQDTCDALYLHRKKGFDKSVLGYIEFWGIMQAIIIQQDSIKKLYKVVTGNTLARIDNSAWEQLRSMRNLCAGHAINKGQDGKQHRTFMGRDFISYECIKCETWNQSAMNTQFHKFKLSELLENYEIEARGVLDKILTDMIKRGQGIQ